MPKVYRIELLSFAKLQIFIFAIIGLMAGILYSVGLFLIDVFVSMGWVSSPETPGLSYGTVLAFGALIGMPVLFATFGSVFGYLEAILYNLFAHWFGGIKLDLEL